MQHVKAINPSPAEEKEYIRSDKNCQGRVVVIGMVVYLHIEIVVYT